jgi:ubiquinone biosynthesis monooxygenase Coq7
MSNQPRHYSRLDQLCINLDEALRAVWTGEVATSGRPYPAAHTQEAELTAAERKHIAGLMRVNHAGEISAQALYQGQALTAKNPVIKKQLTDAAIEEGDHLMWCRLRLAELDSRTSLLNPLWYLGSFLIGVTAGVFGDEYSLGFIEETESQVVKHLEKHLQSIPDKDKKTLNILHQMQQDEALHQTQAQAAGAVALPALIKKLMSATSKLMVKTAYWL